LPDTFFVRRANAIDIERKIGAGEGIRTLDPDLGKVDSHSTQELEINTSFSPG